jgi:L-amino acid N-acyltransferase YncA
MATAIIRPAGPADIPAITAIYADAVLTSTASFEIEPPDEAEMMRRMSDLLDAGYPYLAAGGADGAPLGYAYAGPYRSRPAYRHAVEDSVYLARGAQGKGIGRALLAALIAECEARLYRQMVAVIGGSDNAASIRLHQRAGFAPAGVLRNVGHKHGRWLDSVLMQRPLGQGADTPPSR